jgi:hypothetical protein
MRKGWAGHLAGMGEMRNTDIMSVGKREVRGALGRLRLRLERSIKSNVREIWWDGVDCFHLIQDTDQ